MWFRNLFRKMGYYCDGCGKYKKTSNPPFGRRVCLTCQLSDADEHKAHLDDLILRQRMEIIGEREIGERLDYMRERFLPSKAERKAKE